jgi:sec-independent protein translocase protein TatA
MNAMLLGMPGGSEMLVVLFVLLLLFGGTRLPQLAKGLGQSIKEFKKGVSQIGDGGDDAEAQPRASLNAGASAGVVADEISREGSVSAART